MIAKRLAYIVAQVSFLVLLIIAWQWAASSGRIDRFFFGEPRKIGTILRRWWSDGTLSSNLWETTRLVLIGFFLGLAIGTALGCLLALSRFFRDVFEPYLVFLNALPRIIVYPFLVVWLGFGLAPKVVTIVLVMATSVAISVASGFKDVDADYVSNVRAMGASRTAVARNVYAPSLALWLLSTSRVTFGFALQAAMVVEILGSRSGLGFLILRGETSFDVNIMLSSMAILVLLALAFDALLSVVERRTTRWMPAR